MGLTAGDFFYVFTIIVSTISTVVSFAGCYLYHIYSRDKSGRLLKMITLLVFVDGVSSMCFVLWYILDSLDFVDDDRLCSFIWPVQLFSFLCAFGFVILIANRFKRVNTGQCRKEHLNFPLTIVPLIAFILTLPTIIIDQAVESVNITELISNSHEDKNEFCFFNSSVVGTIINYVCLQLPSLVTIIYNIYAYRQGVEALTASSPQVVKKSRYKAGKYLFVLLLVWIPSLTVHAYHTTISSANEPYYPVLVVILLTSCQGIFNALAYAWEYYPFRKWVFESILKRDYDIEGGEAPFAPGIYRTARSSKSESSLAKSLIDNETTSVVCLVGGSVGNNNPISSSSMTINSSRRDHLIEGERSVRFGPNSQHVISVCSVYDDDDDDEEDEGSDVATLEGTVNEIIRSPYKILKKLFNNKKDTLNLDESISLPIDLENGIDETEILDRNTDINGASDFVISRQREKKRGKTDGGRARSRKSRSPSPS